MFDHLRTAFKALLQPLADLATVVLTVLVTACLAAALILVLPLL